MKFKYIHDDVYNATVYFYWGGPMEECHKRVGKKLHVSKDKIAKWEVEGTLTGQCFTMTAKDAAPIYVVWIEKSNNYYTLSHEAIHLACRILRDRKIQYSEDEEILAYYHTYWLKTFWRLMGRKK